MPRVAELIHYPIKACAGTSTSEALLTRAGLRHDRTFMVVDADGDCLTQREFPRMATIRPDVKEDGRGLTLAAPGVESVELDVDSSAADRRDVLMFDKHFRGIDQGRTAAEWFSDVLGSHCGLVRVPPEHDRVTTGATEGTSAYADSCPILVSSPASLAHLNERIDRLGDRPVPMSRFRPNVVLDGIGEPHFEDRVRRMAIGDAVLGYAKIAIRCAVTTIDQARGVKIGHEPLRTLADYRRARQGGVAFGSKFAVLGEGPLGVGAEVTVTEWGDSDLS